MFNVCLCVRYQSNPKESHYNATKKILKYLKGNVNVGLWYPSDVSLNLVGYFDSNFVGYKLDRKSTRGKRHFLRSSLISWHNKKRACVTLSTIKVKYISTGSYYAQIIWLKQQLSDFILKLTKVPFMYDNIITFHLTKIPVQHSRTKYIEIRPHFIRDHFNNGDCEIQFVETTNQLVDLFTKPLAKYLFNFLRNKLGIIHFFQTFN